MLNPKVHRIKRGQYAPFSSQENKTNARKQCCCEAEALMDIAIDGRLILDRK